LVYASNDSESYIININSKSITRNKKKYDKKMMSSNGNYFCEKKEKIIVIPRRIIVEIICIIPISNSYVWQLMIKIIFVYQQMINFIYMIWKVK